MEELQPEALEELVQELAADSDAEGEASPEVEKLLRDLQPARGFMLRLRAARQLGRISKSSHQVVQALLATAETDDAAKVRAAAAESLLAPVHQELLQEYPDLVQRAQSATEQAATQREKQRERMSAIMGREVLGRKEPKVSLWILGLFAFGILWVVVIAASGAIKVPWLFGLMSLPGVAVLTLGFWGWRGANANREVFLRSMKETVGRLHDKHKEEHESEYGGTSYTYHVSVLFEAEDTKMSTRVMVLTAQVSRGIWKGLSLDESVGIRYAAEDPSIALIEGEW